MIEPVCMICDKLTHSLGIVQLDRTIYSDLNGRLIMRMQREKDPDSDQYTSSYMLIESHTDNHEFRAHKVLIKFCPFCGKELL